MTSSTPSRAVSSSGTRSNRHWRRNRLAYVSHTPLEYNAVMERTSKSYANNKQKLLTRLNRIEGQVRGLAKMLEEQRPCMEVLQQLASAQAALRGVTKAVLQNYLQRCATDAIKCGDPAVYDDLMTAIYKFVK